MSNTSSPSIPTPPIDNERPPCLAVSSTKSVSSKASFVREISQSNDNCKEKRNSVASTNKNGINELIKNIEKPVVESTKLEDQITNEKLIKLQQIFADADEDGEGGLDIDEFRHAMIQTMGGSVSDEELEIVFMKVDTNCDGTVDWDEYLSYMLLEYREKDQMTSMLQDKPFPKELEEIPDLHRETISRVTFWPQLLNRHANQIDNIEYDHGRYVTASRDGFVTFWNQDVRPVKTHHLELEKGKSVSMWLTDIACMVNVNMIAGSSTERDITFFDCHANKFEKTYRIVGMDETPVTMDYWFDTKNMNKSILLWGDAGGNVHIVTFSQCTNGGPFGPRAIKKYGREIKLSSIEQGLIIGVKCYVIRHLHEDWVLQVKYYPSLDMFISCCQEGNTSMYMGDFQQTKITSHFKVRKGILCFDYCKTLNVIATGGLDHMVRVWNPYVTSKAVSVLKGHAKAVIQVIININREQVISIAQDKTIRVYDLKDQSCVQNLPSRNVAMGPHPISSVFFNPKLEWMLLANNHLAVFKRDLDEERTKECVSHNAQICAAIYNPLFKVMVSACHDSVVSVWEVETGQKVMQFINAHKKVVEGMEIGIEITAMEFDPTKRRLITGARDGSVKMWNFNNGACLRVFQTFSETEVTGILWAKQFIMTVGWNRHVTMYLDIIDDETYKQWAIKHRNDILSVAYYDPSILATSSYDGDIIIWSLETGHVYCRLNLNDGVLPRTSNITETTTLTPHGDTELSSDTQIRSMVNIRDWMTFNTSRRASMVPSACEPLSKRCTRKRSVAVSSADVSANASKDFKPRKQVCALCDGEIVSNNNGNQETEVGSGICVCHKKEKQTTRSEASLKLPPIAQVPLIQVTGANSERDVQPSAKNTPIPEIIVTPIISITPAENSSEQTDIRRGDDNGDVSHQPASQNGSKPKKTSKKQNIKYDQYRKRHEASVEKVIFLQSREHDKSTATLLSCGAEGWIRAWSIHHQGGLLGQFNAAHLPGESVLTMTIDSKDSYLITGDTLGYVKTWDISEYCLNDCYIDKSEKRQEEMRKWYAKFPFTQPDTPSFAQAYSKQAYQRQKAHRRPPVSSHPEQTLKTPPLLNSYRAHLKAITHIEYVEDRELVITSSVDCTIRLWTLTGRFIGTFGQKTPWAITGCPVKPSSIPRTLPKDVKRVASATTLKILNGGVRPKWRLARNIIFLWATKAMKRHMAEQNMAEHAAQKVESYASGIDMTRALQDTETILGKSYQPKQRHKMAPNMDFQIKHFGDNLAIYAALPYAELTSTEMPDIIKEIQERHNLPQEKGKLKKGFAKVLHKTRFARMLGHSMQKKTLVKGAGMAAVGGQGPEKGQGQTSESTPAQGAIQAFGGQGVSNNQTNRKRLVNKIRNELLPTVKEN